MSWLHRLARHNWTSQTVASEQRERPFGFSSAAMVIVLLLGLVPAGIALPAEASTCSNYTRSHPNSMENGTRWRTNTITKRDTTCNDFNLWWVGRTDRYGGIYRPSSGGSWTLGSGGFVQYSAGERRAILVSGVRTGTHLAGLTMRSTNQATYRT
jgi:hypothetical protein